MSRYEDLLDRRMLLLNSVMLRQNPHNVNDWLRRVELYEGKPRDVIRTYTEAIQTIDVAESVGKIHDLWIEPRMIFLLCLFGR